jgi:hypothetical protein
LYYGNRVSLRKLLQIKRSLGENPFNSRNSFFRSIVNINDLAPQPLPAGFEECIDPFASKAIASGH